MMRPLHKEVFRKPKPEVVSISVEERNDVDLTIIAVPPPYMYKDGSAAPPPEAHHDDETLAEDNNENDDPEQNEDDEEQDSPPLSHRSQRSAISSSTPNFSETLRFPQGLGKINIKQKTRPEPATPLSARSSTGSLQSSPPRSSRSRGAATPRQNQQPPQPSSARLRPEEPHSFFSSSLNYHILPKELPPTDRVARTLALRLALNSSYDMPPLAPISASVSQSLSASHQRDGDETFLTQSHRSESPTRAPPRPPKLPVPLGGAMDSFESYLLALRSQEQDLLEKMLQSEEKKARQDAQRLSLDLSKLKKEGEVPPRWR